MDPRIAHLQALFASLGLGLDVVDLIEVGTAHRALSHGLQLPDRERSLQSTRTVKRH